ncbi:HET-domain-containing protein, partial [Cryphonectria parasitica EP155]
DNLTMATDTFVYEALSHPKREFRLLKIQTYNSETAPSVRCELASFPLDEAPPYHTISYTWGDDEDKAQPILILVNDRQFKALPNSEGALRQAWAYNRDLHIWIDSICINQQDISERNAQVSIMGQIYMNCEQVLACVGD